MTANSSPKRPIKTAETVFEIIESIRELAGPTAPEIAAHNDLAESTTYQYLATLESKDYVVNKGGEFHLGLKFFSHGMKIRDDIELIDVARSELENLAEETGETVWLAVEEHGYVIFVARRMGQHAVRTEGWIGMRTHLHAPAAGKAMLAYKSEPQIEEIIDAHGLPQFTEHTITNKADLISELETVRDEGIAFSDKEKNPRIRGVAGAIRGEGDVFGAVSVAAPADRMLDDQFRDVIPQKVKGAVNAIEVELIY